MIGRSKPQGWSSKTCFRLQPYVEKRPIGLLQGYVAGLESTPVGQPGETAREFSRQAGGESPSGGALRIFQTATYNNVQRGQCGRAPSVVRPMGPAQSVAHGLLI